MARAGLPGISVRRNRTGRLIFTGKTDGLSLARIDLPTFVAPLALPISAVFSLRYIDLLCGPVRVRFGDKTTGHAENPAGGMGTWAVLGANAV